MLNNTFIVVEPDEDSSVRVIPHSFPNIPTALQWAMDNTSIFNNGQKFFISDFNTGQSKKYTAQLTMVINDAQTRK